MGKNQKVSVIIPVYNSEYYLEECIESVLNQSYPDLEVIAINDGSLDNSLKILNKFKNKITIISTQNNGLALTVNLGIKKMTGYWMKWVSPDDILPPTAIQTLVEEGEKLPENTILYSNWEMIDDTGKKIRPFRETNYNNLSSFDFNIILLTGQQINVNTTLIPSSIFKLGCIMRNLEEIASIDYDFFLRAGIIFKIKFHLIEKSLLKYRIHRGQLSHKNISKSLKFLDKLRIEILSKLDIQERERYQNSLENYYKNRPLEKKVKDMGLKLVTSLLPNHISNHMLVFYLNKIRSRR